MRYVPEQFNHVPRSHVIRALRAEGIMAVDGYPPMNKEPFIEHSLNLRSFQSVFSAERLEKYRRENHLPHNDELCKTALYLEQNMLIGEKSDVDDILTAIDKVQKNASMLS
jgi:dTDP-4-amino-4,6-dideoxygalactose transaminase